MNRWTRLDQHGSPEAKEFAGPPTENTLILQPFQNPRGFAGGFQRGGIECLQHCFGFGKEVNDARKTFASCFEPVIVNIDQRWSEKHQNSLVHISNDPKGLSLQSEPT